MSESIDFTPSTRQFSPIFAKCSLQFLMFFADCIRQIAPKAEKYSQISLDISNKSTIFAENY